MPQSQFLTTLSCSLVSSSGHDEGFDEPNLNLINDAEIDSGWLSAKFCTYPQELVYEFPNHAAFNMVRLLSHSFMISSKIEVLVGNGKNLDDAHFRRLGFIRLSDNRETEFKARELKDVKINASGSFIKVRRSAFGVVFELAVEGMQRRSWFQFFPLSYNEGGSDELAEFLTRPPLPEQLIAHKNHDNEQNLCQQIGVVGLEFIGQYTGKDVAMGRDSPGEELDNSKVLFSASGPLARSEQRSVFKRLDRSIVGSDGAVSEGSALMWRRVDAAREAKDLAVQCQDYARAKLVKATEIELRECALRCDVLMEAKEESVWREDYDRASILMGEIASLNQQSEAMLGMHDIKIPPLPSGGDDLYFETGGIGDVSDDARGISEVKEGGITSEAGEEEEEEEEKEENNISRGHTPPHWDKLQPEQSPIRDETIEEDGNTNEEENDGEQDIARQRVETKAVEEEVDGEEEEEEEEEKKGEEGEENAQKETTNESVDEQQQSAAIMLQGKARQRKAKERVKKIKQDREEQSAAVVLQGKARQRKAKERVKKIKQDREEHSAAIVLQGKARQRNAKAKVQERRRTKPPEQPVSLESLDVLIDDADTLSKAMDAARVFGEENIQRVYSKDWKLREEGLKNVASCLGEIIEREGGGIEVVLAPISNVLIAGVEDKASECFLAALNLLSTVGSQAKKKAKPIDDTDEQSSKEEILVPRLTRDVFCPMIEGSIRSLVGRLGDANSSIADAALEALYEVGGWDIVGPTFVAQITLKRLFRWEEQMTRPVANRLRLLKKLLVLANEEHAAGASVLAAASLKFANDAGAFQSASEVISIAADQLERAALDLMGDDVKTLMGDLKGTSMLAEMHRADRQRHIALEKSVERTKTLTMDLEHTGEAMERKIDDVKADIRAAEEDVDAAFDALINILNERRGALKSHLGDIKDEKIAALEDQKEGIVKLKDSMIETSKMAADTINMLHKEEYSTLVEPLTNHLDVLRAKHSKLQKEPCTDSDVSFRAGGSGVILAGIAEHLGSIFTGGESINGLDVPLTESADSIGELELEQGKEIGGKGKGVEALKMDDIHLQIRTLAPEYNNDAAGDTSSSIPSKETIVVEVRKGSAKQNEKDGRKGEIVGHIVVVNKVRI